MNRQKNLNKMKFEMEKNRIEPKALLEAALFIADKGLRKEELSDLIGLPIEEIEGLLESLKKDMENKERGIKLVERNGEFLLQVKRNYLDRVRHLAPHQDMSRGVLRTLSVIAYHNPILQKEVVDIRGNGAYSHIEELKERNFIKSEKDGRTKLLSVTDHFLRYFEIESTEELKKEFDQEEFEELPT